MNSLSFRVERVAKQLTAVVRVKATHDQISKVIPATCGQVWEFAKSRKLVNPGRLITLYHDDQFNLEIGVEIGAPFADDGRFVCSEIPAGLAAAVTHVGPYPELGAVHAALKRWAQETGKPLVSPAWEVYAHPDGPTAVPRTDVYHRLEEQG